ncbi:hypothetical protein RN607_01715 [Demequina capsici]|uniref:Uncharacterized protein n=1 Tax=Demequina capsici TaxID=3075620 RepID=A0AA96J7Y0_9MICO|nr:MULTISPECIES: hypothetical protein [unclassified Demequina]WNM24840.1 hypothetical protein RN606_01440 [Demequina sp. OYTSA14]WNM27747.1 hypothetical protein RN607_01715 [Demequina sp. PMTSA13]
MRLSDWLHGEVERNAGDGSPLDGTQVSIAEAARRVQRRRTMRASGVGAVATVAVAAVAAGLVVPNLQRDKSSDLGSTADVPAIGTAEDAAGTMLAAGYCGGTVDGLAYGTASVSLAGALTQGDATTEYEPGQQIDWSATATALEDVHLAAGRPFTYAYVLWDGIIVATYPSADDPVTSDAKLLDLAEGDTSVDTGSMDLVNCWDGTALPAGKYQVVLTQEYWNEDPVPVPTLSPAPEKPVPSEPAATSTSAPDATSTAVEPSGPSTSTVAPDSTGVADGPAGTSAGSTGSGIAADTGFRVVSDPIDIVVAGDPVADPFAAYLGGTDPTAPPATAVPDDLLTPDAARSLYEQGLSGAWDMAPGTQRVVLTQDSTDTTGDTWNTGYYGCAYDGVGSAFPQQSAAIDLLGVDLTLPSSISVSYGWVVDDNPELSATVTNTSGWTLPYWYQTTPTLVLVRDGAVVANAYTTSLDRYGNAYVAQGSAATLYGADGSAASSSAIGSDIALPYSDGYMAPGASFTSESLWREVDACDSGAGLAAGTYTVLEQRSVYVDSGYAYYGDPAAAAEGDGTEGGAATSSSGQAAKGSSGTADAAVAPAPAPDMYPYDYVELTIWTSLGTVQVTG